jgi:hypothetical protein
VLKKLHGSVVILVLTVWAGGCAHQRVYERADRCNRLGETVVVALEKGGSALLVRQHKDDGSWGGDDVKVASSHKSDYPVAITSLSHLALLTALPEDRAALEARRKSLRFILDTIQKDGTVKNTRDNTPKVHERNVWSQGFSMYVLASLLRSGKVEPKMAAELRSSLTHMSEALAKTQQADGGWTYDKGPSESFLTSTILIGLIATRDAGIQIPENLIEHPRRFIAQQSNPGNYVSYQGLSKKRDTEGKVRDSIGRSTQLELALLAAGGGSRERLTASVEAFFKHRERFDKVRDRETGCHQSDVYGIGTFYIFFGYFYVAQALEVLGGETRATYLPVLRQHFLALQKVDGHWLDSRDHCGESYGTAMGMLILSAPLWTEPEN